MRTNKNESGKQAKLALISWVFLRVFGTGVVVLFELLRSASPSHSMPKVPSTQSPPEHQASKLGRVDLTQIVAPAIGSPRALEIPGTKPFPLGSVTPGPDWVDPIPRLRKTAIPPFGTVIIGDGPNERFPVCHSTNPKIGPVVAIEKPSSYRLATLAETEQLLLPVERKRWDAIQRAVRKDSEKLREAFLGKIALSSLISEHRVYSETAEKEKTVELLRTRFVGGRAVMIRFRDKSYTIPEAKAFLRESYVWRAVEGPGSYPPRLFVRPSLVDHIEQVAQQFARAIARNDRKAFTHLIVKDRVGEDWQGLETAVRFSKGPLAFGRSGGARVVRLYEKWIDLKGATTLRSEPHAIVRLTEPKSGLVDYVDLTLNGRDLKATYRVVDYLIRSSGTTLVQRVPKPSNRKKHTSAVAELNLFLKEENWDRVLSAADRVEHYVGADAYLDVIRARCHRRLGNFGAARALLDQAIRREITLEEAYWERIELFAARPQQITASIDTLRDIRDLFSNRALNFLADPKFTEIRKVWDESDRVAENQDPPGSSEVNPLYSQVPAKLRKHFIMQPEPAHSFLRFGPGKENRFPIPHNLDPLVGRIVSIKRVEVPEKDRFPGGNAYCRRLTLEEAKKMYAPNDEKLFKDLLKEIGAKPNQEQAVRNQIIRGMTLTSVAWVYDVQSRNAAGKETIEQLICRCSEEGEALALRFRGKTYAPEEMRQLWRRELQTKLPKGMWPMSADACLQGVRVYANAFQKSDSNTMDAQYDWDGIFTTAAQGARVSPQQIADVRRGFRNRSFSLPTLKTEGVLPFGKAGGLEIIRFEVLGAGECQAMLRLIEPKNGTVHYVEVTLFQDPDKRGLIRDLRILSTDDRLSALVKNRLHEVAKGKPDSTIKLRMALEEEGPAGFFRVLGRMAENERNTKAVQVLRLRIAQQVQNEKEVARALAVLKSLRLPPASLAMLALDSQLATGDYKAARKGIDLIEAAVGKDPYLDVLRAKCFPDQQATFDALFARALRDEVAPVEEVHWTNLKLLASSLPENADRVDGLLVWIRDQFPDRPLDFNSEEKLGPLQERWKRLRQR